MKRQRRKIEGELQPQGLLYTSEILSSFIHSEFTRRLNHLDDNRVLLKATGFKTESYISATCFKGV
jgi:hypothetical protein